MEPFTFKSGPGLPPTREVGFPHQPGAEDSPAAQLVEEMAKAWRNGQRLLPEELLAQHPGLRSQQDVVLRLVCEEICLRREGQLPIEPAEFVRRFPQWQQEIKVLFECQRILQEEIAPAGGPQSLGEVRDFRLLAELGQGGQGRVYLATQPLLADRPVVLKITPCRGREHLSLARLQHTNIVPLYWAQDVVEEDQRLLCMPYFGSVTLAGLQKALVTVPVAQRSGQQILDVLDQAQNPHVPRLPTDGPARLLLARASFAQAVAWMGACLADALHYAHERELVHLDLKPANILLTTDGQPMLLDFHLARHPVPPGAPEPQGLGGTPEFMSPEQEAAFEAICQGKPVPQAVDGRSDLFSLGLVLYQVLGGSCLYRWKTAQRLETCNPQVSLGLADIVHKCLARDLGQRYAGADQLAADLRRHLNHQLLRGVPNRSWQERWQKWRRRKPHALAFGLLLLVLLVLVGMAGGLLQSQHHSRLRQEELAQQKADEDCRRAEKALAQSQAQIKEQHYDLALAALDNAQAWIPDSAAGQKLSRAFVQQQRLAREKKAAQLLHAGVDILRVAAVADSLTPEQRQALEKKCRLLWDQRALLLPLARTDIRTRQDLIDLAVIWSGLRESLAASAELPATQRATGAVLAEVDKSCGLSRLVAQARLRLARALGLEDEAQALQQRLGKESLASAWEEVAWARSLIAAKTSNEQALLAAQQVGLAGSAAAWEVLGCAHLAGDNVRLRLARQHLHQALVQEPGNYWANYYHGVCAYRLQQTQDAIQAFHVCVALAPRQAETYYNRALAYTQAGACPQALDDYSQALKLDPGFGQAALNRALLHARLHNYAAALADLYLARDHGADPMLVQANLLAVQKMQGRLKGKARN